MDDADNGQIETKARRILRLHELGYIKAVKINGELDWVPSPTGWDVLSACADGPRRRPVSEPEVRKRG